MTMTPTIPTVNVIIMQGDVLEAVHSWPDTPEGNASAEFDFKMWAFKYGCPADDIDAAVEDGHHTDGKHTLFLAHGTH